MATNIHNNRLTEAKCIVIKIGSAILVDESNGAVRRKWLASLAEDISLCRKRGQKVIIVSSGAVAVGRRHLHLGEGNLRLDEKQAAAATGMLRLAHAYQETLSHHAITVAQVLLTLEDSENRRRYLNARNTLEALLKLGAVPLINENDTVATDEIRMGDNDRLSARVAAMISADVLILLSDVDGLYSADPRHDKKARFIDEVNDITPEIENMAGYAPHGDGSGGMVTKLAAAKIALNAGCAMVITDGKNEHPLRCLEQGCRHTWFLPTSSPHTARKRWISGGLKVYGSITVDDGALKALKDGKSLLPAGVSAIEGNFVRGDAVKVKNIQGNEVARGLSAYSATDAKLIMGHKSSEIEDLLGYRGRDEIIRRGDLVIK